MPSRRPKDMPSLSERLSDWANRVREQADKFPPGPERDALLQRAEQANKAMQFDAWSASLPSQR